MAKTGKHIAYRTMTTAAAPSKKRKRTSSICSSSSSDSSSSGSDLDWDELTEVLWDCMRPHVQRMAVVTAAAQENNPPSSPGSSGRAFTMPWKAIWKRFIELTGADVGRRSVQARGRTLISKRHKGERRHRWGPEEDGELMRAVGGVERECLSRGEPHVTDMDDKEKTVFWDTVYHRTSVRRTKKSMRERHLILDTRRSSGQSVDTSGTVGSPYMSDFKHDFMSDVKLEEYMMIEPFQLSSSSLVNNNNNHYFGNNNNNYFGNSNTSIKNIVINKNNNVVLQPIAVKQEELKHSREDGQLYFEIAHMMESWDDEDVNSNINYNNNYTNNINNSNNNYNYTQEPSVPNYGICHSEELQFDEFLANDFSLAQPLAAGSC